MDVQGAGCEVPEADVEFFATGLLRRYGRHAAAYSLQRSQALRQVGDHEGYLAWVRVAEAAARLCGEKQVA